MKTELNLLALGMHALLLFSMSDGH